MAILSDEEKRVILLRALSLAGNDQRKKYNLQELGAALRIIEKTLGNQWYQKSGKNLIPQTPKNIPSNYNFLLENQELPPITALLRSGLPENYSRIIQFASYVKELWNQTNIEEKIRDYEYQERKREISFDHFNRFFFELKVAASCKRRGLSVSFIPKQKRKTPDFQVTSPQGATYIECKKKDAQTKIERDISENCQKIEAELLNHLLELKLNYSIKIKFNKEIKNVDVNPVVNMAYQSLLKREKRFNEDLDNISIEGEQLTGHDVVQSSKSLPESPDLLLVQHFSWSAEMQNAPDRTSELFELREIDTQIRNFRIVAIYSSFVPSKVQSILSSIKDAGSQLLESTGHGIAAIEISLARNGSAELQTILNSLPSLLEKLPHISAVILFLEQTLKEGEFIRKRTIFHGYVNPAASNKLPKDIETALRTSETIVNRSLLDD
jgi:hypothetical protein